MSIDRKELGENGFKITPIERGQTFVTKAEDGSDRALTVLGFTGINVVMKEERTNIVVTEDLFKVSRGGIIEKRPIIEILPPVNED